MKDLFSISGNVVLVSGGSRGIGRAIAEACRSVGAQVVISARGEASLLESGFPHRVCDVANEAEVVGLVESVVEEFGRIDALFNVAGVNFRHAAESFPTSELDRILSVNLRGSYLMARECGRTMIRQHRGKIVNIASLHTHESLSGVSAYGTSKGAIGALTRALAVEWGAHNVQVNAIAPGMIRTEFNASLWENNELRGWVESRTPAGRLGVPADLVGTAIFLASGASDFLTGQVLYVDGGISAGSTWPLVVPS
jgi:gluconate 5-dehydrogenase